ncbi:MAG: NUDIX domain-containing protein [Nanoarchaeota archaeon]
MLIQKPSKVSKHTIGCIITYKNKLLLLHRTKDNLWGSVAGSIKGSETKQEAAKREVKEELGLKITPKFFTTTYHKYNNKNVAYHIFTYTLKENPYKLITLNKESHKFKLFGLAEALKLRLFEDEDYCLKLFAKKYLI